MQLESKELSDEEINGKNRNKCGRVGALLVHFHLALDRHTLLPGLLPVNTLIYGQYYL